MSSTTPHVEAEAYRGELLGYCYRYFGCYAEAADAVQETMARAWQHADGFDGRSSLRTWLYRIATNVCLDMKKAPQRRSLPTDLSSPGQVPDDPRSLTTRADTTWIGPISDDYLADPANTVERRDSVRLAFIAVLQLLPPRQRALLILRDVLDWSAQECAELLDISVASVNSALARARRTIAARDQNPVPDPDQDHDQQLLAAYVAAFAAYDVDRLVGLLTEDASFSMPPYELWLRSSAAIEQWWRGPGQICRNSRLITTGANRQPAVAVYHDVGDGRWEPFALHVLDTGRGRIVGITHFMGPTAFAEFGLPPEVIEINDPAQRSVRGVGVV
ncbi:DNA-directed RNA polymerase sigma-70 factor [Microlunatus endophyticus]|uniref:DNA-directed RNA polymerase sigma-70 factor n=1 Tax=Microlunatus endophyticus TaxID=1716077 RepID=A0A917SGK5_9ACTN|nr:RNA polymerase subunit sigma-70 [Microlunatus endophyticus]GGL77677.1 DNA-directed RNA polymerase sigma-70 factor [Microlunatus endophyticus]